MKRAALIIAGVAAGVILATWGTIAYAGRSSSGTYSLPTGNPVVTGTTITSTWANNTLSDLAAETTNSLDRNGRGAMLAPLLGYSGSQANPGFAFSSDPGSGLYRSGSHDIRMSVNGSWMSKWTSSGLDSYVRATGSTTNRLLSDRFGEVFNVKDFGAVGDDSNDDTTAIQAAITAATSGHGLVYLPAGSYKTTGTLTVADSVNIAGETHIGKAASAIHYHGAGTALKFRAASYVDGSGTESLYAVTVRNLVVQGFTAADIGIALYGCSEFTFENVTVGGDASTHFNTGIRLEASDLIRFYELIDSYNNDVAMDFVRLPAATGNRTNAQIIISGGAFFLNPTTFRITGLTGASVHDAWIEATDYAVQMDDSLDTNTLEIEGVYFHHNSFLWSTPGAAYTHQLAFYLQNQGGKLSRAMGVRFEENKFQRPVGTVPASGYPFTMVTTGGSASSLFHLALVNNFMKAQNAALVTADTTRANIYLAGNVNLDISTLLAANTKDFVGTANVVATKQTSSTFMVGKNSDLGSGTMSVYDGTATTGSTNFAIKAGAGQSTNSLMNVFTNAGTSVLAVNANGELVHQQSQGPYFNSASGSRWHEYISGAESGGNAGSNFILDRLDDSGTRIDSPVTVTRSTGAITVKDVTATTVTTTGNATVGGDLAVTGNVTGNVTFTGAPTTSGTATFSAGIHCAGGAHCTSLTTNGSGLASSAGFDTTCHPICSINNHTSQCTLACDSDGAGTVTAYAAHYDHGSTSYQPCVGVQVYVFCF